MDKAASTHGNGEAGMRQNLADADCPEDAIACFMALRSGENIPEQLAFLAMHRKTLLGRIRRAQHALDCLDFLAFSVQRQNGTKGP